MVKNEKVELRTPYFGLTLGGGEGLQAESWENRLTGTTILLGNGSEIGLDIGESEQSPITVKLRVTRWPDQVQAPAGQAVFELQAEEASLLARVTYQWDAAQPVLRKFVEIVNTGDQPLDRLLNVRLGEYPTDASQVSVNRGGRGGEGGPGFPVYLNEEFFMGLAHPSGWVKADGKRVLLLHHPYARLAAGQRFACMETVYGVGKPDGAREAFRAHLTSRMRRVLRSHDKPYAMFDVCGGNPGDNILWIKEEVVTNNIRQVAQGQKEYGCHFDHYALEFWHDPQGDGTRYDPERFPHGVEPINAELAKLGTLPGLWFDSSGTGGWSINGGPAAARKAAFTKAVIHHIKENGVRSLKFDTNTGRDWRSENQPGTYSTEANDNAMIEFLSGLDEACPEVFMMLYWGYNSPWWLLHADTLFNYGLPSFPTMEARDPSSQPTPYPRHSVIQLMDQALRHAVTERSIPPLGKDSLGVWLSREWDWNSYIGKEHWQESLVMDMCRGSLLAQIFSWSVADELTPSEWRQMADFIALLKAQPDCFRNSRWIVGDPWKDEPYGYCCTDGKRAFVAINNSCWRDRTVTLKLGSEGGLPDGGAWDIYRWYPDPARLADAKSAFGESASIVMRPFDVVLLEVVPARQAPSLDRAWRSSAIQKDFAEPTTEVSFTDVTDAGLTRRSVTAQPPESVPSEYHGTSAGVGRKITGQIPPAAKGGMLVVVASGGTAGILETRLAGQPVASTVVWKGKFSPAPWQAWRIAVEPSAKPQEIVLAFSGDVQQPAGQTWKGFFIPLETGAKP